MSNWKGIIAKSFTPEGFKIYLDSISLSEMEWHPEFVVVHNTAEPCLKNRPNGLTLDHIHGLEDFYKNEQKWSAGPHLFVDDKEIWAFTRLTTPGVHSPSWNHIAIGVEMLGDFAVEPFDSDRGLQVHNNAVAAIAMLCAKFKIDPDTIRLHKEDPKTTHVCPGKNVIKETFIQEVKNAMTE